MLSYELAKQLKKAGFPFDSYVPVLEKDINGNLVELEEFVIDRFPTLSELIEACGDVFYGLHRMVNGEWLAFMYDIEDSTRQLEIKGETPEEAVTKLWLALNKKGR